MGCGVSVCSDMLISKPYMHIVYHKLASERLKLMFLSQFNNLDL